MKRAHPSDGAFAMNFRPRSPPGSPTRNDAGRSAHEEPFATEDGRRKWLMDERESLHQSIINYAGYAEYIAGMVEDEGKTVSSIPTGLYFTFVRSLRQLAKLNILIEECEKDKRLLMGDITFWREKYKDTTAKDMVGMDKPPMMIKNSYANVPIDAARTIWNPEHSSEPPSIVTALWSMAHQPLPSEWKDESE
ncbi:hypothetical protein DBV05_g11237 [Lasiodiplodia theobromae]|uniref:Uncharacterized protein n=1 Tax=Lasiodiplodia theobromae TaxID=45133 RepID=A0A5N5CXJ1_9PEZI|nr:hypothetical protein DBV05_g11237 [Lasiodiplodia theobromae]